MSNVPRREGSRDSFSERKPSAIMEHMYSSIEKNISDRKKPDNSKGNTVTAEGGRAIDTGRM